MKEDHSTKVYDIPSDCYLTGESCSEVEEIEVFQIIFSWFLHYIKLIKKIFKKWIKMR